jgi:hypothetical protein
MQWKRGWVVAHPNPVSRNRDLGFPSRSAQPNSPLIASSRDAFRFAYLPSSALLKVFGVDRFATIVAQRQPAVNQLMLSTARRSERAHIG